MTRTVIYSRFAKQQLGDLYQWIAEQSGFPDRAEGYVSAILDFCTDLADFPHVGTARDDLRSGLRTIGFRRRVVIAFAVHETNIEVLGIFYDGQAYESKLLSSNE